MGKITNLVITQYASSILGDVYKLMAIGCGVGATFKPDLWPVTIMNTIVCILSHNLSNRARKERIITSYEKKKTRGQNKART